MFFISVYANKTNLILKIDSFIKLKKPTSDMVVQWFVFEKAIFPGQDG